MRLRRVPVGMLDGYWSSQRKAVEELLVERRMRSRLMVSLSGFQAGSSTLLVQCHLRRRPWRQTIPPWTASIVLPMDQTHYVRPPPAMAPRTASPHVRQHSPPAPSMDRDDPLPTAPTTAGTASILPRPKAPPVVPSPSWTSAPRHLQAPPRPFSAP